MCLKSLIPLKIKNPDYMTLASKYYVKLKRRKILNINEYKNFLKRVKQNKTNYCIQHEKPTHLISFCLFYCI